ncbi:prolactin-releasing peptide receptor-like [Strongylocentrotus purpuratus]|uniref:G-protein coupled receptors family 1 profile domain-containing protein n=1 Tax=Strongylocentrotus purpuratus TaxID=7668 RepID=A0A7M7RFM0_STRPU|nr:prolactin-releasing peptide receptor-like [Strongylocentrotus purpuratus]
MGYYMNSTSELNTLFTAMNDSVNDFITSEENYEIKDQDIATAVNLTYYTMVLVLGLPGNTVIMKAYAWKKRKTSTDILIMAQATVDFVACVFCPVFTIRNAFPGLMTKGLCHASSLANNATAFASLYLTTAIGIDRYMAVCRPLRRRMTVRMSIFIAILCTVVSIVTNIPAAVFTEVRHFGSIGRSLCFVYGSYVLGTTMSTLVLFTVSLMTNTVLYALIYVALRKRAKINADMTGKHPVVATVVVPIIPLPALLRASQISGHMAVIQILYSLRLLNHIVNFFVYYLANNSFRRNVRESCKHCRCTQKLIM